MTAMTLTAVPVDRERTLAVLVAAFGSDPVIRWVLPDARGYLTHFPALLALSADLALAAGTADYAQDYAGAALWLAPDVELDGEALAELAAGAVEPQRHGELFELLEQMDHHHPDEACWYLPFIGVDPRAHGQGTGSRLLAGALERCDADGLPAYLEATSPRNRALYERHGFTVTGEICSGDSPPLWPMLRRPGVRA